MTAAISIGEAQGQLSTDLPVVLHHIMVSTTLMIEIVRYEMRSW